MTGFPCCQRSRFYPRRLLWVLRQQGSIVRCLGIPSGRRIAPVSYTHLDYEAKTELIGKNAEYLQNQLALAKEKELMAKTIPVSYTHLDVYKRQVSAVHVVSADITVSSSAAKAVMPLIGNTFGS